MGDALLGVIAVILAVAVAVLPPLKKQEAYAAFRDGRAQVVTYAVPGEGQCKAVLIDGRRQAEKCEGEKP